MSQHNVNPINVTRGANDLAAILNALQTGHIGTSRPSYVTAGMTWLKDIPATNEVEQYYWTGTADVLIGTVDKVAGKFKPATGGGGLKSMQVFTSSGTWTRPDDVTSILVHTTNGGAGGGRQDDSGIPGATTISRANVEAIATATVVVGGGGAGASAAPGAGGASSWVGGGVTINASTGALRLTYATIPNSNIGAASYWGQGSYGTGGRSTGNNEGNGQNGQPGVVVIYEF